MKKAMKRTTCLILTFLCMIGNLHAQKTSPQGTVIKYDGDQYIRVTTAEQFLNSIISGINILVAKDTEINLTPILENKKWWDKNYAYFKWRAAGNTEVGPAQAIISEAVDDGRQLTIANYKKMIIRGEGNSRIVVEPRYAFCLNFKNCEQISIMNLTIGHTTGGHCEGGVIGVKGGWRISLHKCDLYGCGTYGLQLDDTRDFSMYGSNIHDCTYGIMTLQHVEYAKFERCDFFRNKEFTLIDSQDSNVNFWDCRFYDNGTSPLFNFNQEFSLGNCVICHPTEFLGTVDKADKEGSTFYDSMSDTTIKPRGTGPK